MGSFPEMWTQTALAPGFIVHGPAKRAEAKGCFAKLFQNEVAPAPASQIPASVGHRGSFPVWIREIRREVQVEVEV